MTVCFNPSYFFNVPVDTTAYFTVGGSHFLLMFQILAKELVRSRHGVNRLHENKAQLNSVSMRLGEVIGMIFSGC
jgi:hypothetical protein